MVAIAGAILINAACILAATTKDTLDIYITQRLLSAAGSMLIAGDLSFRFIRYVRRAKAEAASKADGEPRAAADRRRD